MFTELSDKGTFSLEIFSGNPDRLSVTVKHHPALSSVCVRASEADTESHNCTAVADPEGGGGGGGGCIGFHHNITAKSFYFDRMKRV